VLALNVAEVDPAATVTEAGTVSAVLLLKRVTIDPPVGAAVVSVRVQILTAPPPNVPGAHVTEETVGT
jgi:hypothetical protein